MTAGLLDLAALPARSGVPAVRLPAVAGTLAAVVGLPEPAAGSAEAR